MLGGMLMALRGFVPPVGVVGLHIDSYLAGLAIPDPEQITKTFGEGRKCFCGAPISAYWGGCLCKHCYDFINNFAAIQERITVEHFRILEFLRVHDRKGFREWQKTLQEIRQQQRQIDRGKVVIPA